MKKVAVIGLGKSGLSALAFLEKKGYLVVATDDKIQTPYTSESLPVEACEFVVISPGVPLSHPAAVRAKKARIELFCDVELAFRTFQHKMLPMIGITGSNGKTTTTSLTCHLLNACNIQAMTAGNIGKPILDEIEEATEALVIELSSFQLETIETKVLDCAAILNITPNHLDRHGTMEEYSKAKYRIAACLRPEGKLWVPKGLKGDCYFGFDAHLDLYSDGTWLYRFGKKETVLPDELQNNKSHDVENFLAAYALSRHFGADPDICRQAFSSFTKPKHRLQYLRTVNGISFYDDSKATSVEAVLRAVESLNRPIVLIAGGVHKGYPYDAWRSAFKDKVRALILIGEAADIIEKDMQGTVATQRASSFEDAFMKAQERAMPDDAVLLSPGCASYDMFSSFEERGNRFQSLVASIKA